MVSGFCFKCGSQMGEFLGPPLWQCPTCLKIWRKKVSEAEGREGVQEAGLPGLPKPDAGGRPHELKEVDAGLLTATAARERARNMAGLGLMAFDNSQLPSVGLCRRTGR
jgi:hypothetical protein